MAPRVGFEPTTNRLTVDCSTAELPRIRAIPGPSIKFGASGKAPACANQQIARLNATQKKGGGRDGPPKALGMVGCLQGKTRVFCRKKVNAKLSGVNGAWSQRADFGSNRHTMSLLP